MRFYIPEDGILHSYRRDNLKSYLKTFLQFSAWLGKPSATICRGKSCFHLKC
jgi:hypothetical protein